MLPWPADPEHLSGMPRGMIETVLEAPGGKLRVLTTHLEYYSPLQRRAQVRRIRELHREACARARIYQPETALDPPFQLGFRPGSAIFCGDFKFFPDSEDYQELLAPAEPESLRLLDAWRIRHGDMARAPTAGLHGYPWPDKPDCYDYFFVTEDLAARVAEVNVQSETSVSDHQPIVLDLG